MYSQCRICKIHIIGIDFGDALIHLCHYCNQKYPDIVERARESMRLEEEKEKRLAKEARNTIS